MRVCYIGESLDSDKQVGSRNLMLEAIKRGHEVWQILPKNMSLLNGKIVGFASKYQGKGNKNIELAKFFYVIFFRTNPPVDMEYLTVLHLLQLIENEVLIINRPSSIIQYPEKIFPHFFKFSPPTLITQNRDLASAFIRKHKQVVMKPLYSYGGDGVKKISSVKQIGELAGKVIFQKFLPEIANGDRRLVIINGKLEGVIKRTPTKGSILSNFYRGGSLAVERASEKELGIHKILSPILKESGILICGVDLIDGKVTEINITSPATFNVFLSTQEININAVIWKAVEKNEFFRKHKRR